MDSLYRHRLFKATLVGIFTASVLMVWGMNWGENRWVYLLPELIDLGAEPPVVVETERRLTSDPWNDTMPVFSPDGEKIAYLSDQSGQWSLWLMNSDGGERKQLTASGTVAMYPSWKPDSRRIVYISEEDGSFDLQTVDIATLETVNLTSDGLPKGPPRWGPDGEEVLFAKKGDNWNIYVINLTGQLKQTQLTKVQGNNLYPSWTPEGERILFSSDRSGDYDIWMMKADGSQQFQLTYISDDQIKPSMSPDGLNIAFVSEREGERTLWVLPASGQEAYEAVSYPLFQSPGVAWFPEISGDTYPMWNPLDEGVMFFSTKGVYAFYADIDVTGFIYIRATLTETFETRGNSIIELVWSAGNDVFPSWKPDGKGIVYASNRQGSFDIWLHLLGAEGQKPVSGY